MDYDFDTIIDRHNSDCIKFDFTAERHRPDDVLSYWVADMDFPTAPELTSAIIERASSGIFGYTDVKPHYEKAVSAWYTKRFGYTPKEQSLVVTPGVVFAIAAAIYAFTKPGDGVLIQNPVYYPFAETVQAQGRTLVTNDLVNKDDSGYYEIDFKDFERKIKENNVRLFLLCSPHNPVGRVWKRQELEQLAEICLENGVKVFADEIHSDFVYAPCRHIPFAALSDKVADNTILATAPTKTFNLAGLQVSDIFISNDEMRRNFLHALDAFGYSQKNTLGLVASEAAYTKGEAWFEAVKKYIEQNIDRSIAFIKKELPQVKVRKPEGTYLIWLDFRGLGLTCREIDDIILNKAKLWLDSGRIFGSSGQGFERINVCCSWSYLEQGLIRLAQAFTQL